MFERAYDYAASFQSQLPDALEMVEAELTASFITSKLSGAMGAQQPAKNDLLGEDRFFLSSNDH